jgi:purine-nucleoside phosphorylase
MSYFNVPKHRWQRLLGISSKDIPDKLIIEGHPDFPGCIERRKTKLSNVRSAWMPNLVIGEYQGRTTGYGVSFGGPMASQLAHIYCKLGTKKVVQIGTGGGLQKDLDLGDIVVSESVLSLDGVWKLYRQKSRHIRLDGGLRDRAVRALERRGANFRVGRTVAYYDILLEEEKDLLKLSKAGYLGVEMEAGATGSVTGCFGVPAIVLFVVSDNSMSGKDLFYKQTEDERKRIKSGRETIFDVALEI